MRLIMENVMAKVIEFYVPGFFPKGVNCTTGTEGGKVIEFRLPRENGLPIQFREPAPRDPQTKEGAIPIWLFCS
jgi:hypothetical protein